MSSESIEQKVQNLEEVNKSLIKKLERLEAIQEIQNLFSKMEYLAMTNRTNEVPELFAEKAPGVRVSFGEVGTWEGPDAARKSSAIFPSGDIPGLLNVHAVTNPYIEVAEDGKTAKGVWLGTGFVAMVNKRGEPKCRTEYDRYGIDFIKEDGRWKFWHFHLYAMLRTDRDQPWAKQFEKEPRAPILPEAIKPDKPPIDHYPYHPTTSTQFKPALPKSYETFDDNTAY
jgi:hypothetical protein